MAPKENSVVLRPVRELHVTDQQHLRVFRLFQRDHRVAEVGLHLCAEIGRMHAQVHFPEELRGIDETTGSSALLGDGKDSVLRARDALDLRAYQDPGLLPEPCRRRPRYIDAIDAEVRNTSRSRTPSC